MKKSKQGVANVNNKDNESYFWTELFSLIVIILGVFE